MQESTSLTDRQSHQPLMAHRPAQLRPVSKPQEHVTLLVI
jgi:hypothetical protein